MSGKTAKRNRQHTPPTREFTPKDIVSGVLGKFLRDERWRIIGNFNENDAIAIVVRFTSETQAALLVPPDDAYCRELSVGFDSALDDELITVPKTGWFAPTAKALYDTGLAHILAARIYAEHAIAVPEGEPVVFKFLFSDFFPLALATADAIALSANNGNSVVFFGTDRGAASIAIADDECDIVWMRSEQADVLTRMILPRFRFSVFESERLNATESEREKVSV